MKQETIEKPQLIDYYPADCDRIKHIKGTLYESYMVISEEAHLTKNIFKMHLEHTLADIRSHNYFVRSIYCKYRVMSTGNTIYAFELVKLKEPIFHHSINTVNGALKAMKEAKIIK